jgi:hypothetical protein
MAKSSQELRIFRGSRDMGRIQAEVDPDDAGAMQKVLKGWLQGERWGESTWPDFTIVAYEPRRREVRL